MVYKIKSLVWQTPGKVVWYFVSIDKELSKEIKANQWFRRGFGAVAVVVKIGKTKWTTSIFPSKEGEYILPLKASVRKNEKISEGDNIEVIIKTEY